MQRSVADFKRERRDLGGLLRVEWDGEEVVAIMKLGR